MKLHILYAVTDLTSLNGVLCDTVFCTDISHDNFNIAFSQFLLVWMQGTLGKKKKYTCVSSFPTYPNFCPYPKHFITLLRKKS